MRVDFFVVGAQKSGTTALDAFLRRHPQIEMAAVKEPHFFDDDALDWSAPDYGALHRHYDWSAPRIRGEATPIHSYWPNSIERICAYNPHARIIMGLRHPALRAFSHWRMETARGAESLPFSNAIREGRARMGRAPHRVYSYVERGFYARQVERLLACFPARHVHFFRTDALWLAPENTLTRILALVGASEAQLAQGREYIVPLVSQPMWAAADDLEYLRQVFAADVARTAELTGLDLSDWLEPGYCEPMGAG